MVLFADVRLLSLILEEYALIASPDETLEALEALEALDVVAAYGAYEEITQSSAPAINPASNWEASTARVGEELSL